MNNPLKTAIVSGINRALTQKLLTEDYRVIGTSRTGQIDGLNNANLQIVSLEATDEDSIRQAVPNLRQRPLPADAESTAFPQRPRPGGQRGLRPDPLYDLGLLGLRNDEGSR